jgi:Ni,Fe-hydrogenase I large subunit
MKNHLLALLLFIGLVSIPIHSSSQSIVILQPNEQYKAPPKEEMIVMDTYTFGNYHYTASQYDTLKQEVGRLDSALVVQDSLNAEVTKTYERILILKQSEIQSYQDSYQRLEANTNECIKQQNQLQLDYKKIEQKNKRVKKWRNFFMGTSAVLGTIVILSVIR